MEFYENRGHETPIAKKSETRDTGEVLPEVADEATKFFGMSKRSWSCPNLSFGRKAEPEKRKSSDPTDKKSNETKSRGFYF